MHATRRTYTLVSKIETILLSVTVINIQNVNNVNINTKTVYGYKLSSFSRKFSLQLQTLKRVCNYTIAFVLTCYLGLYCLLKCYVIVCSAYKHRSTFPLQFYVVCCVLHNIPVQGVLRHRRKPQQNQLFCQNQQNIPVFYDQKTKSKYVLNTILCMCLQRIKTICSWSYGEMNSFILLERVGSFTSTNSFIKVITRTYVLNKYSVMTNTSTGCVL